MRRNNLLPGRCGLRLALPIAVLALVLPPICVRADQVEMQNGDRYAGTVLSLNATSLSLKSDVLGTITLPRNKIALVALGDRTLAKTEAVKSKAEADPGVAAVASTNTSPELSSSLRQIGANTNLVSQVQSQFLKDAGPEATKKFNEMLGGLMTGRLTVSDIRAQARSAADQLRAAKKELGEDAGSELDGYLAILDNFLGQSSAAAEAAPKAPRSEPKPKPWPAPEEE
jgi:hypothetical protein